MNCENVILELQNNFERKTQNQHPGTYQFKRKLNSNFGANNSANTEASFSEHFQANQCTNVRSSNIQKGMRDKTADCRVGQNSRF